MAYTYTPTRLASGYLTTSWATVFTVPANKIYVVRQIHFMNISAGARNVSADTGVVLFWGVPLAANGSLASMYIYNTYHAFSAGQTLQLITSAGTVDVSYHVVGDIVQ